MLALQTFYVKLDDDDYDYDFFCVGTCVHK